MTHHKAYNDGAALALWVLFNGMRLPCPECSRSDGHHPSGCIVAKFVEEFSAKPASQSLPDPFRGEGGDTASTST